MKNDFWFLQLILIVLENHFEREREVNPRKTAAET